MVCDHLYDFIIEYLGIKQSLTKLVLVFEVDKPVKVSCEFFAQDKDGKYITEFSKHRPQPVKITKNFQLHEVD